MYDHLPAADWDEPLAATTAGAAVAAIPPTDGERLMRFCRHRDQAAFAEVVETHAPMVWGVCSQILRHRQDVEDAFQATFLILARKAKAIRAADSAAGWLYRVAFRTALLARHRRGRRPETSLAEEPPSLGDQLAAVERSEQCCTLLEELHSLPPQYREPIVLCYLEGRSRSEAADQLGVTSQTVKGRLARGTRMLRSRLVRRGVALSTTMGLVSAAMASTEAAAAPALASTTTSLAAGFAWKLGGAAQSTTAAKTAAVCTLAEKGLLAMTLAAAAKPAVAAIALCLAAGSLAIATADGPTISLTGDGVLTLAAAEAGDAEQGDSEIDAEIAVNNDAIDESHASQFPQPETPVDVLIEAPAPVAAIAPVRTPFEIAAKTIELRSPKVFQTSEFQFVDSQVGQPANSASPETLKLEAEYWELKSRGLKKKAEGLQLKAQQLRKARTENQGAVPEAQIIEAEADAELALAEVKLCELNAQRVKEAREAAEASTLKSGDTGEAVKQLQQSLNQLKDQLKLSAALDVDGDFGPLTEQAVIAFQKAYGLNPSGVADRETLRELHLAMRPFLESPLSTYGGGRGGGGGMFGAATTYAPPQPAQAPSAPAPPTIEFRAAAPPELQAAVKARAQAMAQAAEEAKAHAKEIEATARAAAQKAQEASSEAARKLATEMEKLQQQNQSLQEQLQKLQQEHRQELESE